MEKLDDRNDMPYEQAMAELESVVNLLESGDLTLDESIKMFERGVSLVRLCNKKLDDIEKRITLIIEGKDSETEKDFDPEGL
ncbi:MAG: exodeoxyribonuclease VII small subunit [Clostridiaceae bacterium]|nr:exodeoxyribonuclease VII small subunit [Clostridiaceae bacterium]